jgi:hypothetical protein
MRRLLCFLLLSPLFSAPVLLASDAKLLAGKWLAQRENHQWHSSSQTIEVKGDKFTFQMLDKDGQVVLHAEGDLKLEKLGTFSLVRFVNVRGGESQSNLETVDDEFNCTYILDGDTWTVASNFDKEREPGPILDVYHRAAAQNKTLVIDEIDMADTPQFAIWFLCFEATAGETSRRHYIENKGYDKNQVTIHLALELPGVQAGQKCSFKMQIDDVDTDACTDDVDNRSTGEFSISDSGAQAYKPESNWRYTIRWHLR